MPGTCSYTDELYQDKREMNKMSTEKRSTDTNQRK